MQSILTTGYCVTFLCLFSWSQFTAVLSTVLWRGIGACPFSCLGTVGTSRTAVRPLGPCGVITIDCWECRKTYSAIKAVATYVSMKPISQYSLIMAIIVSRFLQQLTIHRRHFTKRFFDLPCYSSVNNFKAYISFKACYINALLQECLSVNFFCLEKLVAVVTRCHR